MCFDRKIICQHEKKTQVIDQGFNHCYNTGYLGLSSNFGKAQFKEIYPSVSDNRQSHVTVGYNEESHVSGGTHCLTAAIPSFLFLLSLIPAQPFCQDCHDNNALILTGGKPIITMETDWCQILICFYCNTKAQFRKRTQCSSRRILSISELHLQVQLQIVNNQRGFYVIPWQFFKKILQVPTEQCQEKGQLIIIFKCAFSSEVVYTSIILWVPNDQGYYNIYHVVYRLWYYTSKDENIQVHHTPQFMPDLN